MRKIHLLKFCLLFILSFALKNVDAVNMNVSGTISSNTTWSADTVKVTADLLVDTGATLTISAGTYVQLQGNYVILVKGFLQAVGTVDDEITFSVLDTNTKWKGIRFDYDDYDYGDTVSVLNHCIIAYGDVSDGYYNHNMGGAICSMMRDNITVSNCYLSNNKAVFGGAFYAEIAVNIKLINNVIVNNTATSSGGGIYLFSSDAMIINNTISNNDAPNNSAFYASNLGGKIANCIIYGNNTTGYYNDQFEIFPQSNDIIYNCDIEDGYYLANNSIDEIPQFVNPSNGTGCYVDGLSSDFSLMSTSSLIDKGNNLAIDTLGYYEDYNENFRFDNMRVDIGAYEQNTSNYVCGNITSDTVWSGNVLIYCDINVNNGVTLTIKPNTNVTFLGSYSLNIQGRILAQGKHDSLINITAWFKSEGWKGIRLDNVSSSNDSSKFEYCKISYKKEITDSQYYYGAIYANNSSKLLVRNSLIINNYSKKGAGITLISSDAKVVGNLIAHNQSELFGGGIYLSNSAPSIINNTIVKNKTLTEQTGGGIYALSSNSSVLKNNIIYFNEDSQSNQLDVDNIYPSSGLNITYGCVQGGYTGLNNISTDPKFKFSAEYTGIGIEMKNVNYSLHKNSPCLNIGTSNLIGLNIPVLDVKGDSRIQSTTIDLGCYEGLSSVNVCGTLIDNTFWNESVINVNCDVIVPQGVKLSIAPGTKILFNGHNKIFVENGVFEAIGSEEDTIRFISADTTIGWKGIEITSNMNNDMDSIIIDYCSFKYAKKLSLANSDLTGSALTIHNYANTRVSNSLFYRNDNIATASYSTGAAISIESPGEEAKPIINNNTFIKNHGKKAILNMFNSKTIVRNNIFKENYSEEYGIITSFQSGCTLLNNLVSNNNAYHGSICIYQASSDWPVTINGNIISNNDCFYSGGIYVERNKALINNNTIVNNYSSFALGGGGIFLNDNSDVKFKNNIIYGNKILGNVLNQVSLFNDDCDPKFYNNDIEGGVLGFTGNGSGIFYSGVFNDNIDVSPSFVSASSGAGKAYYSDSLDWSIQQGSALINVGYFNSSSLNLLEKDINGNPRFFNGRIDIGALENQDPVVSPCTIANDTKWDADTIRITCNVNIDDLATLTIMPGTNVLFMGNYEINVEGSIVAIGTAERRINFMINDTTDFYDTTVATGGWDGINFNSVIVAINDSSKFEYCTFSYAKAVTNNYFTSSGAAMNIYNSSKISIKNCIFSNNYSTSYGGALYIESSNIKFENNIVCNNTTLYYGGAIYFEDCILNFTNNVIVNNKAMNNGGIYLSSSELNIKNSIFWNNYKWSYPEYTSYSQISLFSSSNSVFVNNDIQYGESSVEYGENLSFTATLDIDPQFQNPTLGAGVKYDGMNADWSLKSISPLLNKGKYGSSSIVLDIDGQSRIIGDTIDIGAFEIQLTDRFIDIQPEDMNICLGNEVNIVTHINANVDYQWQKNGVDINGKTNRILHIASMSLADSGYYNCIMTNEFGTIGTDTIELKALVTPEIVTSPESTSKCLGSSVTFDAEIEGSRPITYQWYNTNGALGSGASSQSFYQFGEDSISNTAGAYPTPFGNYYWGNKEQYLILASELTAQGLSAGDIPSLAFYVAATNSCPTLSNFILKIGSTNNTALNTSWISGLSTVYSVASYQISSGWNTFGFTSVYTWDGTSNIVVEVSSNNASWIGNGNASVNYSTTSFYSSHFYYADDITNIVNSTEDGVNFYKRPNIKLSGVSISGGLTSYSINSISANSASNYYLIATNSCGSEQSDGAILGINYAPVLTPIAASNNICEDASYTFSTTISQGTSPMTYQWFKDGDSVMTATSLSYNITTADTSNDGIYYCKATNICGSDSTNQSIMIVNEKPRISAQSSSQTVCENQSTTMYVTAYGTAPLTYQWYEGANAISGATNNTYTISSVSINDAESYYCKVSNGCTSVPVSSTAIVLTVNTAPSITTQTASIDVCENNAAAFSTTFSGTTPMTYQWFVGIDSVSSANNSAYTISSVSTSDAGNYYCIASNTCGNVSSNTIPLTVKSAPSISLQPIDATVCSGSSVQFSTSVSGTSPFTYQWYNSSGAIIVAANNSTYLISQSNSGDAGTYYAVITNSCNSVTTNNAALTINEPVSITAQTNNSTVCEHSSSLFSITVNGTTPITYQWFIGGDTISSATNATYTINNSDTSNEGDYYVISSNACNSVQSNIINLTVNQSPSINTQPLSITECVGSSVQFYTSAEGTSPFTYQWYSDNGLILGATSSTYLISQADTGDAGSYYAIITNTCGNATTNNADLTVKNQVSITTQASSSTICNNNSASISITASGTMPIVYQWFYEGDSVLGATNDTYLINNADTSDEGSYYVVASNSCNSVQSLGNTITVNTSPIIISLSTDDTICEGVNKVFQVNASGTNPISYQWYKDNLTIPSGVNSNLVIISANTYDIGDYYVVASNQCGNIQSSIVSLDVNQLATIDYQSSDSSRCEGESMTFEVNVNGEEPLQYQWYKGSTTIVGAQSAIYSISNVNMSDAGLYHIDVSNMCNSVSSSNNQLSVHANPIVNLGNDTSFCDGGGVSLSAGYGYQCQWSNGSYNNQINVTSTGSYFVNVTDQYGCSGVSDTINVDVILPYAYQELCMVGVDSATNKNILIWEKTPGQGISYFNLYKESAVSNVWNLLGNISYDSLSVFIDYSSTPNIKPERYAITIVDSCGNESARSIAHRTMHLTVNAGQNPNDWNLIWNAYEGFQAATYRIFRADSTLNFIKIDSIAGSSSYTYLFTDYGAPSGPLYYAIEIVNPNGSCGPTKANTNYNTSRSNTANNGIMPNMTLAPDFTADVTSGYAPMVVAFTDLTINGTVDSYFWSFGDGDVSTDKNPIHQYLDEGIYQVALSVTNQYGTEYITKDSYIDVLPNGIVNVNNDFDIKVFPNPYKGKTNIVYVLNKNTKVKIEAFNSLGMLVSTIIDEKQKLGSYNYKFSARDLGYSQGVYYLRMTLNNIVITKRIIEVK